MTDHRRGTRHKGLFVFLFDLQQHRRWPIQRLAVDGVLEWKHLSHEEQHQFSNRSNSLKQSAAAQRLSLSLLDFLPDLGSSVDGNVSCLLEHSVQNSALDWKQEHDQKHIFTLLNDRPLNEHNFCLISFEYMVQMEIPEQYVPCEVAALLLSLDGVRDLRSDLYHKHIHPDIPNSYLCKAIQYSEFRHRMPVPSQARPQFYQTNITSVAASIYSLLSKATLDKESVVFCSKEEYTVTHSAIRYLHKHYPDFSPYICCFEDLLKVFRRIVPTHGYTYDGVEANLRYVTGFRCIFHADEHEVDFCAQNRVFKMGCHILKLLNKQDDTDALKIAAKELLKGNRKEQRIQNAQTVSEESSNAAPSEQKLTEQTTSVPWDVVLDRNKKQEESGFDASEPSIELEEVVAPNQTHQWPSSAVHRSAVVQVETAPIQKVRRDASGDENTRDVNPPSRRTFVTASGGRGVRYPELSNDLSPRPGLI